MSIHGVLTIATAMRPSKHRKAVARQDERRKQCEAHGAPVFGKAETGASVDRFVRAELARHIARSKGKRL